KRQGPGPAVSGPAGRPAPLKDTEIKVASMARTHRDHAAAQIASHALVVAVAPRRKVSGFSGGISKAWSALRARKKSRSCLPREAASFIRLDLPSVRTALGRELGWAHLKSSKDYPRMANVVVVGAQWGDEGKG